MIWMILAAVLFILLIVIASRSNTTRADDRFEAPPPKPPQPREPRNDQYFINQYLHRSDEQRQRHKRNQTPW